MDGKNKKTGGNKQALSEQAPCLQGLSITHSSAQSESEKVKVTQPGKQSAETASAVKEMTNAKSEVPAAAPADSRSKRQQKTDKAKDISGERRVVQEEQLKVQDQGILKNDDEVGFEEVLDNPPDSRQEDYRVEYCEETQAVATQLHSSGNENYRGQGDGEFEEFWKLYRLHKKDSFKKVKEIQGDLFKMPPEYALAHCVAEDMAMGSGIAVQFSQQFKSRDELYQQRQKQGGLAVLTINGRYVYYLVTKRLSNGKPTMHTMWSSLRKLQQHMEDNKVDKLAIPRIGCGLDRLEWSKVKAMIEYVFRNADVEVTVCNFQQSSASTRRGPKKCPVRNVAMPLVQIEGGTVIIYFGTEDGFVSEGVESLDTKFKIVNDYKTAKRRVGEVVFNYKNNYGYALYGFIINKRKEDPFDFVNLQKCLGHLKNQNRQDKYGYVAFEAFLDEDDLIVSKICSVLRYSLYDVEVYVCWPLKMVPFMPKERRDSYY